jgi:hypothetical protein
MARVEHDKTKCEQAAEKFAESIFRVIDRLRANQEAYTDCHARKQQSQCQYYQTHWQRLAEVVSGMTKAAEEMAEVCSGSTRIYE